MIKCPFCQTMNVTNTLFCKDCGSCLIEDDRRRTDDLGVVRDRLHTDHIPTVLRKGTRELIDRSSPNDDSERTANPTDHVKINLAYAQDLGPVVIRLKIGDRKREVEIPLKREINIGRVDPIAEIYPELDLTDDIAPAKDVSRQHARISRKDGKVVVQDLASSNGTFLNGRRLEWYHSEPLCNGDVLQLGTTILEVKIVEP